MGSGSSKAKGPTPTSVEIKIKDPVPEETEAEETEPDPMPPIKLTYFDTKGRCEVVRLLLAASGLEFEDQRLVFGSQEWADMKPNTPFGHVPILDFGDARIAQTPSILRFVAKLAGMDGAEEGNTAAAMVDMTADAASDFLLSLIRMVNTGPTEEVVSVFFSEQMPLFLDQIESQLGKTDSTFVAGEKMTYADVVLYDVLGRMTDADDAMFSKLDAACADNGRAGALDGEEGAYPNVRAMMAAVGENEGVKKYLKSRPKKAQEEETSAVVAEADGAAAEGGDGEAAGEEGAALLTEAPVDDSTTGDDGGGGDEAPSAPDASDDKGEEITAEGA